jgi:glycosyltransferase involved in cell wall biosynthesis
MPRHDVAVYAPYAAPLYESERTPTGGAEIQGLMLARALSGEGLRTAHVVFPLRNADRPSGVELVERAPSRGERRLAGKVLEAAAVWRAMSRADASAYVVRTGGVQLAFAALFCRARRRKLVFSSSAVMDFTFEDVATRRRNLALYRWGVRAADAVVVQSEEQLRLARRRFPDLPRLRCIPSFAEPAPEATGERDAFLWLGRIIGYKGPLEFVRLARALPEARFRMVAVRGAAAPPELVAAVEAADRELDNLELLPGCPRAEALDLIARSVAVVNTSRTEGMPNVFLEAWARGVPVLSLNVDPDEVIARQGVGIAAGGSFDRFLEGARMLWRDEQLQRRLSQAALEHVTSRHGVEAVASRWRELFAELGVA